MLIKVLTISRTPLQKFIKVPFYHSHFKASGHPSLTALKQLFLLLHFSNHKNNVNYFKDQIKSHVNAESKCGKLTFKSVSKETERFVDMMTSKYFILIPMIKSKGITKNFIYSSLGCCDLFTLQQNRNKLTLLRRDNFLKFCRNTFLKSMLRVQLSLTSTQFTHLQHSSYLQEEH